MWGITAAAVLCTAASGHLSVQAQLGARLQWNDDCLRLERIQHEHTWYWGEPPGTCGVRDPWDPRFPCRLGNCYFVEISYASIVVTALLAVAVPIVRRYRPRATDRRILS